MVRHALTSLDARGVAHAVKRANGLKAAAADGTWEIDLGTYVPGTYSYTLVDRRTNTTINGSFIVKK